MNKCPFCSGSMATDGHGWRCSTKDCPATAPCGTCGAGWAAVEVGRYSPTNVRSLVCAGGHREHFTMMKFAGWIPTKHGPPRRPVETMVRRELVIEAERLGIKNTDRYIVAELRPVVAGKLRREAGR